MLQAVTQRELAMSAVQRLKQKQKRYSSTGSAPMHVHREYTHICRILRYKAVLTYSPHLYIAIVLSQNLVLVLRHDTRTVPCSTDINRADQTIDQPNNKYGTVRAWIRCELPDIQLMQRQMAGAVQSYKLSSSPSAGTA